MSNRIIRPDVLSERLRTAAPLLSSYGISDAFTKAETTSLIPGVIDTVRMKREFGYVGDGIAIETSVVQDILEAASDRGLVADFGASIAVLDAAVTMANAPGIRFDNVSHGNEGGPGFLITGSGYTALTVSGQPQVFRASIYGTGNTANGVLFQNPLLGLVEHLRVFGLDGFGVKINKCWDCVFGSISVEECGNATHYAFSVNDDGDTSNMSHFLHIQVEKANAKAIYISPNTLSSVFDNIHSEQATPNVSYVTWSLGGQSCQYNSARFHANATSSDAKLKIEGAHAEYHNIRVEADEDTPSVYPAVELEAYSSTDILLENPSMGSVTITTLQTGTITILGGNLVGLNTDGTRAPIKVFGTKIGTLTLGDHGNPIVQEYAQLDHCEITTLTSSSALSSVWLSRCDVGEGNNLAVLTTLVNSRVTVASAMARSGASKLIMIGSTITGALTFTNNSPIRMFHSTITGTVSKGDAGAHDIICDAHSTVGASSSGFSEAPTGGTHARGETHYDPLPSTAAAPGWRCTTAGSPGTFIFKAFANLA